VIEFAAKEIEAVQQVTKKMLARAESQGYR
jgi:hypothetical protein